MKRFLYLVFVILLSNISLYAQDDRGEQILVFRNTGEVNLFFTESLDSITYSNKDTNGIEHESFVSQVFHSADTTMVVPINEIDSVAFGSRNEIVFKKGVKILDDDDCQWITSCDGTNIIYKTSTPKDILPTIGDKLFYGNNNAIFPNGLAANVDNVVRSNDAYTLSVSEVGLDKIFDKLFYAGGIDVQNHTRKVKGLAGKTDMDKHITFSKDFDIKNNENTASVGFEYNLDIKNSFVVAKPLENYYYLRAKLCHSLSTIFTANAAKEEYVKVWDGLNVPLGRYALVFTPNFKLQPFVELNAEIACKLNMERYAETSIEYTKCKGKMPSVIVRNDNAKGKDTANAELVCDGGVYVGGMFVLDFNVLQEAIGARAKLRIGGYANSEFGFGVLTGLSKGYDAEAYAKANLYTCLRIRGELTGYTKNLFTGEENENVFMKIQYDGFKNEYNLLPQFSYTKAVRPKVGNKDVVEVAAKAAPDSLMEKKTELGFEISDKNGIGIDSCFVKPTETQTSEKVCYATDMDITAKKLYDKEVDVRPIIHYAGYTVRCENIKFDSKMPIQPMVFAVSNGASMALSGMPYNGDATKDDNLYKAGPYIPTPVYDSDFGKCPGRQGSYIAISDENLLIGTWTGKENDVDVSYSFKDDGTGSLKKDGKSIGFEYYVNYPQSGTIAMYLNDESALILIVNSINLNTLCYSLDHENITFTLKK